ncbi:hypothetical protein Q3G72_033711 [Acer saccharum]|nr:hypothetical protein Q3G72_033711 [Acer saccharum]
MHVDLVAINTIQEKPTLFIQIDQQQQLYKVFDIQQMAYQQGTIMQQPWGDEGEENRDVQPSNSCYRKKSSSTTYSHTIDGKTVSTYDETLSSSTYVGKDPNNVQVNTETTEYLIENDNGDVSGSINGTKECTKFHGPYGIFAANKIAAMFFVQKLEKSMNILRNVIYMRTAKAICPDTLTGVNH